MIGKVEADRRANAPGCGRRPDFRINGENVPTWDRFSIAIGLRADRDVQLTIVRDGREEQVGVRPEAQGRFEVGDIEAARRASARRVSRHRRSGGTGRLETG